MKEIMAIESSEQQQGVASFGYAPASRQFALLFALSRPLDELEGMLVKDLAGQRLTVDALYLKHSVGKAYVRANYKKALARLEAAGKIQAQPSAKDRPKRHGDVTFADQVVVTFPRSADNEPSVGN